MTVDGREDINQYNFLISQTALSIHSYHNVLYELFAKNEINIPLDSGPDEITFLRFFVMNPFIADWNTRGDSGNFSSLFADNLIAIAREVYENLSIKSGFSPAQTTPGEGRKWSLKFSV